MWDGCPHMLGEGGTVAQRSTDHARCTRTRPLAVALYSWGRHRTAEICLRVPQTGSLCVGGEFS